MSELHITGGRVLAGRAEVPPDKSILHRALMMAALGRGSSRIRPLGQGADNRSTAHVLEQLGVRVELGEDEARVQGVGGPSHLKAPSGALDCGNSGTTMRLMAGICGAAPGLSVVLDGDASLRSRPMGRLQPLEAMGVQLQAESTEPASPLRAPFRVTGGELRGTAHSLSVASAQLKSALLLAGAFAEGDTVVVEPRKSRDHTERMLAARGVRVRTELRADGRHEASVQGPVEPWRNVDVEVPPDVSSAAFIIAAAAVTGGRIEVRTGVNPTRTGAFDVFRNMGVDVELGPEDDAAGEPIAVVRARRPGALRPTEIAGELALRSLDELPVLAGVALFAPGLTRIRDARELRVKESDRIDAVAAALSAFGGEVHTFEDGLDVVGGRPLRPARVKAEGDHRIAMTGAIVGLGVEGTTVIEGADVIGVSYPDFLYTLTQLGAEARAG
ncbi:MAG: 3-phosphoshikimate 1-carboxyvinyltransferase [Myxococcota bacterium]